MHARNLKLNIHRGCPSPLFGCAVRLRSWFAVVLSVVFLVAIEITPASAQNSEASDFPAFDDLMKNVRPNPGAAPATRDDNIYLRPAQPVDERPAANDNRSNFDPRFRDEPTRDDRARENSGRIDEGNFNRNEGGMRSDERRREPTESEYRFGPLDYDRRVPLPAEREFEPDPVLPAEPIADPTGFNWAEQSVSVADLKFPKIPGSEQPSSKAFDHGTPLLTLAEESAYRDLLDAIGIQRLALLKRTASDMENSLQGIAIWEKAFYQYAHARELAWNNGHLRLSTVPKALNGLPNPFERKEDIPTASTKFDLLSDIRRFPEHYVGRPVVIYGRYSAGSIIRLGADKEFVNSDSEGPDDDDGPKEISLMRGSLSTLAGGMQLAVVDTQGLQTPDDGVLSIREWPAGKSSIPVLVKGWVVKKWDQRPLIYCESLRELSPQPHAQLVRQNTVEKSRLQKEETWIYYETLRQLELTSKSVQKQIAAEVLRQRINHLMQHIQKRTSQDVATATQAFKDGKITESELGRKKAGLLRRLNSRVALYRKMQRKPDEFQTFVDMFQYPEVYQGYPVTLHGHVRHVVSYPGDDVLFGGRMLHELWLFTDDSQHNPTVVVTSQLPPDFPTGADIVDRVSVTGCFFKRYVYGSQDTARIAPLIVAGGIDWTPTVDQVQALVKEGHMSAKSLLAAKATELDGRGTSRGMMFAICFAFILTLMILWGRHQREERDRIRLRKRVNEVVPEFEKPTLSGYSLPRSEYGPEL